MERTVRCRDREGGAVAPSPTPSAASASAGPLAATAATPAAGWLDGGDGGVLGLLCHGVDRSVLLVTVERPLTVCLGGQFHRVLFGVVEMAAELLR